MRLSFIVRRVRRCRGKRAEQRNKSQESFSLVSQWSARRLPASLPPSAGACSVTFAARTHATTHHYTTSIKQVAVSSRVTCQNDVTFTNDCVHNLTVFLKYNIMKEDKFWTMFREGVVTAPPA
ncbi:hypothetical protein JYU34_001804 [Plutella xylostella]|uniref:Uncharacterized protein n=1 Tax=Plutella xylostella TaxID=51655 RepID=A0ABQ7R4U0_PLUXY|nr:hypothetical protein JYU34_001804 [Plutella xylostella]